MSYAREGIAMMVAGLIYKCDLFILVDAKRINCLRMVMTIVSGKL